MARDIINGISVPRPDSGEPPDFVGDLRRIASDLPASIDERVPAATTSAQGKVELATAAEAASGTDSARAVTPGTMVPAISARGRLGARFAFYGDSITNFGEGYPNYAALLSQGAFIAQHILSYPGESSTTLANNFATRVLAATPAPTALIILCGANDAQTGVPLATYKANIQSMVAAARAAGITPVLGTVPPNNDDTYNATVSGYNAWLSYYSETERIPLVDFNTLLIDAATGDWKAAYDNGDGLHPNNAANKAMGQEVVDTLANLLTPRPYLLQSSSGSPNLQTNSNFLIDTNADGIANGVIIAPSSGLAYSRVADPVGFFWQRMTLSGGAATKQALSFEFLRSASVIATGDRMRLAMRIRAGQAPTKLIVQLTQYTDAYAVVQNKFLTAATVNGMTQQVDGIALGEVTIQAATTKLQWAVQVQGDGTYDFAQPTLYNLTALGIA